MKVLNVVDKLNKKDFNILHMRQLRKLCHWIQIYFICPRYNQDNVGVELSCMLPFLLDIQTTQVLPYSADKLNMNWIPIFFALWRLRKVCYDMDDINDISTIQKIIYYTWI